MRCDGQSDTELKREKHNTYYFAFCNPAPSNHTHHGEYHLAPPEVSYLDNPCQKVSWNMNSLYAELHRRGWYLSVFLQVTSGWEDSEHDGCLGILGSCALGPVLWSGAWAKTVWDQKQNHKGAILKYIVAEIMHGCADVKMRRIPCADIRVWNLLNHYSLY